MNSHELAHRLLGRPDFPILWQMGHEYLAEGTLLREVIDISVDREGRGIKLKDRHLVIEIGDPDHPVLDEMRMLGDDQVGVEDNHPAWSDPDLAPGQAVAHQPK